MFANLFVVILPIAITPTDAFNSPESTLIFPKLVIPENNPNIVFSVCVKCLFVVPAVISSKSKPDTVAPSANSKVLPIVKFSW